MRLRTKLLVMYAVITAVFTVGAGLGISAYLRRERLSLLKADIVRQLKHIDAALDAFFTEVGHDISMLAADSTIRTRDDRLFTNFVNSNETDFRYAVGGVERKIITIFKNYQASHPYINSVYMGRENGAFVRSYPRERPTRYDPRERPWYRLAKTHPGDTLKTDAYPSVTTADKNIGVVKALTGADGAFYGVVGADVTLPKLTEIISSYATNPGGDIILADGNGTVLAGPDPETLFKPVSSYSPELAAVMSGSGGAEAFGTTIRSGSARVFHIQSVTPGWKIAVLIPAAAIETPLVAETAPGVAAVSIGLAAMSLVTLAALRSSVVQPLEKLTGETEFIARTFDLKHRIVVRSRDEMGTLADAYNRMMESLGRAQEDVRLSEKKYRDIFENATMGIFQSTPGGVFRSVNPSLARLFGYTTPEEMISEIKDMKRDIYVHPEDRERLKKLYEKNESVRDFQAEFRRRDGSRLWISINGQAVRDERGAVLYYEGTSEDVTDRRRAADESARHHAQLETQVRERTRELSEANDKLSKEIEDRIKAEQTLLRSETQYRDLVENVNSMILRWTGAGEIVFANTYAQRFFGYAPEKLIGRNIIGTIVPHTDSSGRDQSDLAAKIYADPQAYAFNENENMRENGEKVWVSWTNRVVTDERDGLVEILSVGNDVTDRKQAEERLRLTLDELRSAKERAEAADRLKSAFLATMSHELRTPLNSIIGFTGVLLQGIVGPLNNEQSKQLGMVRDSARHLLALINDVLDISKIEAGQLTVTLEECDVRMIIEKAVAGARPLAAQKGLDLSCGIPHDAGAVRGDARRIEQVLLNLIGNAVKFTEKGSVSVTCRRRDGIVAISVDDTGIGIQPSDMASLFKPFSQVDTGLTRRYEGTGLGLSICKKLVELMGGTIEAASVWGEGSRFSFTLPAGEGHE